MKILVVEDEVDVADLIKILINIQYPNCEVMLASDGKNGLEQLNKDKSIDIVFSDFNMPFMNGGEMYLEIRKKYPLLPFVLVSSVEPMTQKYFDSASNFFYIDKPFYEKDIFDTINRILVDKPKEIDVKKISDYVSISIDIIARLKELEFPVYLKLSEENFIKVFHDGTVIGEHEISKYTGKNVKTLYLEKSDFQNFVVSFKKKVFSRLALETVAKDEKIEILIDDVSIVHKSSQIFGWTPAVIKMTQENISNVLNVIKKEPRLKNYSDLFKFHQKSRLASHMIMLSLLLTEVVVRMNWKTEGTVEKLIFAAILHDMEIDEDLFADKQTVLIEEEIDSLKNSKEKNKILSHPLDSAELILNWPFCPPDVDVIIRQHHERPDGKGFPFGLNSEKISLLSALFIMCEDLIYKSLFVDHFDAVAYFKNKEEYYDQKPFNEIYSAILNLLLIST